MRITNQLLDGLRDVTIRKWNKVWACRGKFYDYPAAVPQAVLDRGQEVMEMNKVEPKLEMWTPPVPDDPRFTKTVPPESLLDWNDEPALTYHEKIRLFEGMKQGCLIAKAQHFDGLPASVEKLVGAVETADRDFLLQRYIMQSQVWNTSEDKLPKRIDVRKIGWHFKREHGITQHKSSSILLRNLLQLSQRQVSRFPSLCNRKQIKHPLLHSYVICKGQPIVAKHHVEFLLTSDSLLPAYAEETIVDNSATHALPSMWPVHPTVDFLQTNNYELNNIPGVSTEGKFMYPHTIVQIPHRGFWSDSQHHASQLMSCLMFTAAVARRKFGDEIKALPEPVCVQHISFFESRLLLTFFQLNTLDLDSDSGVKNLVWTCPGEQLFDKVLGQPWMTRSMRKNKLENFDGSVFDKFLAVYLYGIPELRNS